MLKKSSSFKAKNNLLGNEQGIAAMMLALMVAILSAFVSLGAIYYFEGLQGASKEYLYTQEKLEISDTFKLILNSPDLCPLNLNFLAPVVAAPAVVNFQMNPLQGYIQLNKIFRKYLVITSLSANVTQNLGPATWEATFTITTYPVLSVGPPVVPNLNLNPHTVIVTGMFTTNGLGTGVVTCGVMPSPQAACAQLGLVWNVAQNRCPTCEMMSGTWSVGPPGVCIPP